MSRAIALPQDREGKIIPREIVTDAYMRHIERDLRAEGSYSSKGVIFGLGPDTSSDYGIEATKFVGALDVSMSYGGRTANTPPSIIIIDLQERLENAAVSVANIPNAAETIDCDTSALHNSASSMIYELRRKTGLNWGQLGRLLEVSRKTVHNWANGFRINRKNQERLSKLTATIRFLDRGAADTNRALLLGPARDGETFFDLLQNCAFEAVQELAGQGHAGPSQNWDVGDLTKMPVRGKSPSQSGLFSKEVEEYLRDEEGAGGEQDSEAKILSKPSLRRTKFRPK